MEQNTSVNKMKSNNRNPTRPSSKQRTREPMEGSCVWTSGQPLQPTSCRNYCLSWLNCKISLDCVTGSQFSWLGSHSVSGSTRKHPPLSSLTGHPRDVHPLLYTPMTFDCRARPDNSKQKIMEMFLDFGRAVPTPSVCLYLTLLQHICSCFFNIYLYLKHSEWSDECNCVYF